jgi:hypothetical protein
MDVSCKRQVSSLCVPKKEFTVTIENVSLKNLSIDRQKCPGLLIPALRKIHEQFQKAH